MSVHQTVPLCKICGSKHVHEINKALEDSLKIGKYSPSEILEQFAVRLAEEFGQNTKSLNYQNIKSHVLHFYPQYTPIINARKHIEKDYKERMAISKIVDEEVSKLMDDTRKKVYTDFSEKVGLISEIIEWCVEDAKRLREKTKKDSDIHISVESAVKGHEETIYKGVELLNRIQRGEMEIPESEMSELASSIAEQKRKKKDEEKIDKND